jgi:hypothetical protein
MSLTRFISSRSPYRRGGLVFDANCIRTPGGQSVIELGRAELERMGEAKFRELQADPHITIEVAKSPGHSGKRPRAKPAEAS